MASGTTAVVEREVVGKGRVCNECGSEAKYTCPGCGCRTCSVGCVQTHKTTAGCSGVRDKTQLVSKEAMNNLTLLSDYRFLEEIDNRLEDNLRNRLLRSAKRISDERQSVPPHLQQLRSQAAQRGTNLKFIPSFFSSHRENTTRYHFKDKLIKWHIKWVFHQADVVLIDRSVDESTSISTLLAKYMDPTNNELSEENNEKLAYYHSASYSRVSVLMKTDTPESGLVFHELEPLKSLRVNFANKVIMEYPVLYVVLKDHIHSYLDYQGEGEGHDDLFSELEEKEEQLKDGLNFFDADSDMEGE